MTPLVYHLVDVFTEQQFGGNQLAVFPDAAGIDAALMQQIARELNLSETTFVMPPGDDAADFRVRIFTPAKEMPMAGHPTVGTAYVLQQISMIEATGVVRFEEGVGIIEVALHADGLITMRQPLPTFGPVRDDRADIAAMLALDVSDLDDRYPVQVVSTGVPFTYVPLRSLAALRRARLRLDVWERVLKGHEGDSVYVFTTETQNPDAAVQSRMFAPPIDIPEDPATGAACGPLGAYLVQYGIAAAGATIINDQGIEMGRPSRIFIDIERDGDTFTRVSISGKCVYVGRGALTLAE